MVPGLVNGKLFADFFQAFQVDFKKCRCMNSSFPGALIHQLSACEIDGFCFLNQHSKPPNHAIKTSQHFFGEIRDQILKDKHQLPKNLIKGWAHDTEQ